MISRYCKIHHQSAINYSCTKSFQEVALPFKQEKKSPFITGFVGTVLPKVFNEIQDEHSRNKIDWKSPFFSFIHEK